jgi:hypothetical protein
MSILCALGGHEAAAAEIYNSGYYFSQCRRCRSDMIRSGAAWRAVPKGHQVVWKGGCHSHSMEPDYGSVLPTLHREANLPALPSPFTSWARTLVEVAKPGVRRTNSGARVAVAEEEREDMSYPYLLAFAAIVGAGLHLVLNFKGLRGVF